MEDRFVIFFVSGIFVAHMVRMVHAVKNAVHVVVNASGEFDGCECDIQFCDECYKLLDLLTI